MRIKLTHIAPLLAAGAAAVAISAAPTAAADATIVQSPGNAQITAQPGMATQQAGQLQQPFGFFDGLPRLYRDRRVDTRLLHVRHEVRWQEITPEHRHPIVYPVVLPGLIAPEVLVRVDDHGSGTGVPPCALER